MRTERRRRPMRTFSLVLLGLAVGAAPVSYTHLTLPTN